MDFFIGCMFQVGVFVTRQSCSKKYIMAGTPWCTTKQLFILTVSLATDHSFILVTRGSVRLIGVAIELNITVQIYTPLARAIKDQHNGFACATLHHSMNDHFYISFFNKKMS